MIKLKDLIQENKGMTFVRFGGLSPVKQKGFTTDSDTGFHSPPARKGIYAFVDGYIETFLLGGGYGDPSKKECKPNTIYQR